MKKWIAAFICIALICSLSVSVFAAAPEDGLYLPIADKSYDLPDEITRALSDVLSSEEWVLTEDLYPEFVADYELTLNAAVFRINLLAQPRIIGVWNTETDKYYGMTTENDTLYAQLLDLLAQVAPIAILEIPEGEFTQVLSLEQSQAFYTCLHDTGWTDYAYPEFVSTYELTIGGILYRISKDSQNCIGVVDGENEYGLYDETGEVYSQLLSLLKEIKPCFAFTDVPEGAWYTYYAKCAYYNGFMAGTGDGTTFSPEMPLTRAMVVQMLYAIAGKPTVTASESFPDVKDGVWYADAACWAKETGVSAGYGDGSFGPDDVVTREQLAVMLAKFGSYVKPATSVTVPDFSDSGTVSGWAAAGMKWALQCGILCGKSNGGKLLLAPQDGTTRAEAAVMLFNFVNLFR